jgi:hypothetical protein
MFAERRWHLALKYLGSIVVLAAVALTTGSATGDNLISEVETRFSSRVIPARLPASEPLAPVRLALSERTQAPGGAHPPPLQELRIDLDRHLGLSVKGLPLCGPQLHESPTREEALSQCEDAKVGSGALGVEVAFPEQEPIQIRGRVSIYNFDNRNGRMTFLLYAYLHAPVTGAVSAQLKMRRRSHSALGWEGTLTMPKIANGAASVTYLGLRFQKGIFSASCPNGKLSGRAGASFMNGEGATASSTQHCSAREPTAKPR